MKKTLYLAVILFLSTLVAKGQKFSQNYWHKGVVLFSEEEAAEGLIRYDLEENIIQLDYNNNIKTYSAANISAFKFTDTLTNEERVFQSLKYENRFDYKVPIFFEILTTGYYPLLSRERIVLRTNIGRYDPLMGIAYSPTYKDLVVDYFFMNKNHEIVPFENMRKSVLQVLDDKENKIRGFVDKNGLGYYAKEDIIKIFDYYNQLKAGNE